MGNFWIPRFPSFSSSSSSTRPSSPGIAQNTSNEGTHSETGSAFSSRLDEVSPNGQILPITPTLKIFSYAELKKATRNFSPDTLLSEGGFGWVFKGWIDEKTFAPTEAGSGMAIAVKKLNSESLQGFEEWQSVVNILERLSHPNIVRLLGYYWEDKELLLVYQFMPRGSLDNHLFRRIAQNTSNEGTHSGTGSAFSSRLDEVSPNGQILPITPTLKIFSYAELEKATMNFGPHTVLGGGSFGEVFKGWIDEKTFAPTKAGTGMAIAVKRLNSEGFRARKEWQSEVDILGSHSHPNIVKLLGYCWEDKELLVVYEFMPRGTLADHLFSRLSDFQSLSWSIRLKIAIGVARGVAFLHCLKRNIIYHSVLASDILLDSDYNAKIYDFGNAKIYDFGPVRHSKLLVDEVDEMSDAFTPDRYVGPHEVGTGSPLYIKQLNLQNLKARLATCCLDVLEFPRDGYLYEGSDVYCFGILLLEMLSGMRALDCNRPREQQSLVRWAKPYLSDRRMLMSRVMDRRLEGQYPSEGAVKAAQLIIRCLSPVPGNRPSMTQVVEALEQIQAIKHDPKAYAPRTKD